MASRVTTIILAYFREEVLGFPPGTRLRITGNLQRLAQLDTIPLRLPTGDIVQIALKSIQFVFRSTRTYRLNRAEA